MDGKPLAVVLPVNVGNAHRDVQGVTVLTRAVGSEDTVPVREAALDFRLPVAHLGVDSAWVGRQKSFPAFPERRSPHILAGNGGIKNEQAFIRRVVCHDAVNILGIDRGYETLHRCVDFGLVVRRGTR